jgi:hypothetical protein
VGETVGVTYIDKKARFKVVEAVVQEGQILVCPLEPNPDFWPKRRKAAGRPLGVERRRAPRYWCIGSITLRSESEGGSFHTAIKDISQSGCYVETLFSLPVGTAVELQLKLGDAVIEGRGEVRTCDPGVGLGIEFLELSDDNRDKLRNAIKKLISL